MNKPFVSAGRTLLATGLGIALSCFGLFFLVTSGFEKIFDTKGSSLQSVVIYAVLLGVILSFIAGGFVLGYMTYKKNFLLTILIAAPATVTFALYSFFFQAVLFLPVTILLVLLGSWLGSRMALKKYNRKALQSAGELNIEAPR